MARLAYVRVSTIDQNEQRQLTALAPYHIDKLFYERISAFTIKRPELQALLEYAREGDTIYICDFSRLARNMRIY